MKSNRLTKLDAEYLQNVIENDDEKVASVGHGITIDEIIDINLENWEFTTRGYGSDCIASIDDLQKNVTFIVPKWPTPIK
jgi:hypothetical protein